MSEYQRMKYEVDNEGLQLAYHKSFIYDEPFLEIAFICLSVDV